MWCDNNTSQFSCHQPLQYGDNGHCDYAHYSHEHCYQNHQPLENPVFQGYNDQQVSPYCNNQNHNHEQQYYQCHQEYTNNGWPAVVPDSESGAACQFVSASSTCCRPSGSPPESSEMTRRDRKIAVQEVLSVECAHLQNSADCKKCVHVTSDDGEEQKIPLSDLVDIVMQAAENFKTTTPKHESSPEQIELCDYKEKRKESNKIAAIKYRERQKKKSLDMKQERAKLEKRNRELKVLADALQQEVATLRQQILENGEFRVR